MANYIASIKKKLEGQRDIELSDLEVYLTNRVAIGEHPHIGEEIEKKLETIDSLQSKIETIDKLFPQSVPEESTDS
tara:strand:+ start:24124 stop:24351 length:228 start_codon:yes stop_codon:yes gene_type:complete